MLKNVKGLWDQCELYEGKPGKGCDGTGTLGPRTELLGKHPVVGEEVYGSPPPLPREGPRKVAQKCQCLPVLKGFMVTSIQETDSEKSQKEKPSLTADFSNIFQTSSTVRASGTIRATFWEKLLNRIKDHGRVLSNGTALGSMCDAR